MPRNATQIDQAARDVEAWLDSLDPDTHPAEQAPDLHRLGKAVIALADTNTELVAAVAEARANGRSWGRIASMIGISRQSAQERFGPTS